MKQCSDIMGKLFRPKSVALIGAGDNPLRINGRTLMFMLRHKTSSKIYPVNPNRDEVQGLTCYRKISQIPEVPDVGLITVSKKLVSGALTELGEIGCPVAIITSAGYAETGDAGRKDQEDLLNLAKKVGVRIMGPNCMGLVNIFGPVILSWCATLEREQGDLLQGDVALISQSGALLGSIWDSAMGKGLGYSCLLSTGNESDLDLSDFVNYFAQDNKTRIISCFIEGLRKPKEFLKAVDLCHENKKPVIVYKVGKTAEGAAAAASHTGALTGSDETFDAMCKAHGIIRSETLNGLVTTPIALRLLPPANGNKLGVFSCSGGAAGLVSDRIKPRGLSLANVSNNFEEDMTKILGWGPHHNPADIAKGPLASFDIITDAMKRFYEEEAFDQIIILMTMMYFQDVAPDLMIKALKGKLNKPVIGCWIGDKIAEKPAEKLRAAGIPTYLDVESCLDAASALYCLGRHRNKLLKGEKPTGSPRGAKEKAISLLSECEYKPDEVISKKIISLYGIQIPEGKYVRTPEEAVKFAKKIGFPVVVKGVSPDIVHKTEAGLVYAGIKSATELGNAISRIQDNSRFHKINNSPIGIFIEKNLPEPLAEVILGGVSDEPGFHKILFGLGGVFVNLLKDASVRLAPLLVEDAYEMVADIRGADLLLKGVRGKPAGDCEAIVQTLISLSQLVTDLQDKITEIDINPLFVYPDGVVAVDALIR